MEQIQSSERGMVFNIQKFSIHDGPGIRSIVFFKGCPLSCRWCSNPEGIGRETEFFFRKDRCIGTDVCGLCLKACPNQSVSQKDGVPAFARSRCAGCHVCADHCPSKAIEAVGHIMTVDEVMNRIVQDDGFYTRSGGGLTLSGGEPLLQPEFAVCLLMEARRCGLSTAIETTGCVQWEAAVPVFEQLDFIHYDLKSMNEEKHRAFTGAGSQLPKANFKKLCSSFPDKPIVVRTPVIPGFNDTAEEIQEIIDFIEQWKQNADVVYELLPYHAFGAAKYNYLDKHYAMNCHNMGKPELEQLKSKLVHEIVLI